MHKYLNYAQIAKAHPDWFEMTLTFNPVPTVSSELPVGVQANNAKRRVPLADGSNNGTHISLPFPFCLLALSLLQMVNAEKFGEILVKTLAESGKRQLIQINAGQSYRIHLRPEDLETIDRWLTKISHNVEADRF
ncbi:MAG: hypothetical protein AAFY41_07550 [Bacteroidota bacterium]